MVIALQGELANIKASSSFYSQQFGKLLSSDSLPSTFSEDMPFYLTVSDPALGRSKTRLSLCIALAEKSNLQLSVAAFPWKIHCGIDIIPVGSARGINNVDAFDILLCAPATNICGVVVCHSHLHLHLAQFPLSFFLSLDCCGYIETMKHRQSYKHHKLHGFAFSLTQPPLRLSLPSLLLSISFSHVRRNFVKLELKQKGGS
ncbi:hypothetical protein Csa_010814 [Cucumis sativus]|uniref:Uncharacterized protein n=1 Tax=Cucumis sativus TaxID=3659 RepID=A0A0A0L2E6_CUCSA|nr:hypothetical protein Csa_010814 [Cucumis sativus]